MERKATIKDIDKIYEIYMDRFNNPFMTFEVMGKEDFLPIFEEMLKDDDLYVYEIDNMVASTYRIQYKRHRMSHIVYFGGFAMHPEYRGRGLGKKIMQEIMARLKNEGIKRLELFVVCDNERAINFYKKLGFLIEGRMKYFLKRDNSPDYLDELVMAKYL
jgi:L-phenylalanine/L-methionine N-acetyltransferase